MSENKVTSTAPSNTNSGKAIYDICPRCTKSSLQKLGPDEFKCHSCSYIETSEGIPPGVGK